MVDGNQLQAHRTWWELRWDVVLIVLAIIAPIVSIVFDVNSEKPDWTHRSGSLMVFCAGFLAFRSLSRHFQNVFNIEKHGHVLTTSYGQIWCMPMKSSGDLVLLFDLFSINEFHTCDDLCQVCEAA